eukprot:6302408-Alexandrium_andersonii.AAC.1
MSRVTPPTHFWSPPLENDGRGETHQFSNSDKQELPLALPVAACGCLRLPVAACGYLRLPVAACGCLCLPVPA